MKFLCFRRKDFIVKDFPFGYNLVRHFIFDGNIVERIVNDDFIIFTPFIIANRPTFSSRKVNFSSLLIIFISISSHFANLCPYSSSGIGQEQPTIGNVRRIKTRMADLDLFINSTSETYIKYRSFGPKPLLNLCL